jgi:maleate isomerase
VYPQSVATRSSADDHIIGSERYLVDAQDMSGLPDGDAEAARKPNIGAWLHDDDFGWRGRLGAIIPSTGVTFDHEWARMLPKGVSYHVTRLLLERGTPEALDAMTSKAPEAARLLKTSRVNAICYGCTIGSLYRGRAGESELGARLEDAASAPVVMMAASAAEALAALGARRVAVANPYTAQINELVLRYLEESGFEVAAIATVSISESWNITMLKPDEVVALARTALQRAGSADALFLSCGNMRSIDVIDRIEKETGCPTVSSNQAMLWKALKVIGISESVPGFGSLLQDRL